jgi:fructose-1,6-bisphosphatase/inositol monophosphatase family enzyme
VTDLLRGTMDAARDTGALLLARRGGVRPVETLILGAETAGVIAITAEEPGRSVFNVRMLGSSARSLSPVAEGSLDGASVA